jgi:hypothetical protein
MPIVTRDKRGMRARESSEEIEDPDSQLDQEAAYEYVVRR